MHPGVEICDCFEPEFDTVIAPKPNLSLPSTPSTESTRSKRSFWSDDEESSSDNGRDQKRVKTRSLSPFLSRLYRFGDINPFLRASENLFVDKTKCIIDLPDKFQYLVLRPPQFGKTMFLSTLYHFYDIHGAREFDERFGSLAVVTKAATPVPHSQHLCLSFHLSDLLVDLYCTDIMSQLANEVSLVLTTFLTKYAKELELTAPGNYLDDKEDIGAKFAKTFDLVRDRNYTLFVGVDDYDSPTRTLTFTSHQTFPFISEDHATAREVEHLLDSCFWRPLMAAIDVIDKLWITGALLVNYPTLGSLGTGDVPGLENVCGFTEEEALYFTQSLLDETPNITDLCHSCGNYGFSSQTVVGGTAQSLLHPRLLINRILELSVPRAPVDEDSFKLLSDILETLPDESDVPEAVTLNDLIDLLATGAVDLGGKTASPFDLAATKAVTWSALHFAGALTYDGQSRGTHRIPNSQVLSLIHSRVDDIFDDRYNLGVTFMTAWYYFCMSGDPEPLLELLSQVLRDLARRSFGRKREPNLQGILELVMRNSYCRGPRAVDPIVLEPADILHCIQVPAQQPEKDFTLELKTLTLRGMWQAANLSDDEPTVEALEALHEELLNLKEDELLIVRPYAAWSSSLNAMETVLVESFFDSRPPENPRFLAVGGAHVLLRQQPREDVEEDEEHIEEHRKQLYYF
ncbi:hypothetical protein B0H12DRAFT_1097919 [Mycena haematopus]|nr:hypothetical protein B0H12DRAFT_1097919 [Mycena haematopus]